MKKLLTILAIFVTLNAFSQNTTTLPSGTVSSITSTRIKGTDSLHSTWLNFPGIGYNQFYSATEINLRFLTQANAASTYLAKTDTVPLSNRIDLKIPLSQKGASNGVAGLDGGGKVPLSQLPANLLVYKGQWNPVTNSPTLSDGTGTLGWVYEASVTGTINLGSGALTFNQGDFAIYNGSAWQLSAGTDRVTSVNGQQGIVVLNADNISEGTTNKYYTDARVATYGNTHYQPLGNQLTNTFNDVVFNAMTLHGPLTGVGIDIGSNVITAGNFQKVGYTGTNLLVDNGSSLPLSYFAGIYLSQSAAASTYEVLSNKVTTLDNSATHYPSSSAVTTAFISKNNLQEYKAVVGIGDSNLEGYGISTTGVGATNWFNIVSLFYQKPSGINNMVGFTNFKDPTRYGITIGGSTSIGNGPTNTGLIMTAGSTITFTAAANSIEFWYNAAAVGGSIELRYNGTLYRTIACNTLSADNQSSFSGVFTSPSSASGTYTLTCIGADVNITALFQSINNTAGQNQLYFLRDGVSAQNFPSFNLTNMVATSGLIPSSQTLYLVALGTNGIYNSGLAQPSTQFATDILNYATALNTTGGRMVFMMPPQSPTVSTFLEPYVNYHNAAVAVCQANNILFLDLNALGLTTANYVSDGIHYNVSGHAIIAAAVENFINTNDLSQQNLRLPGSPYLDQTGSKLYARASGTNTYTATIIPAMTSYVEGQVINIFFLNSNTGASTININGLGAKNITKFGHSTILASGNIEAQQTLSLIYDGAEFQIIQAAGNSYIKNSPSVTQNAAINISGPVNTNNSNGGLLTLQTASNTTTYFGSSFALFASGSTTDNNIYVAGNNPFSLYTNNGKRFSIDGSGSSAFTGNTSFLNYYSISATPTIVVSGAAGTGATASIVGNNQDGVITINTGTATGTGVLATITMSGSFAYPVKCIPVFQVVSGSASYPNFTSTTIAGSGTSTTFAISAQLNALTASTTYVFNYHNGGY